MKIPRVFHQVWVGPDPFSEEFIRYRRSWIDCHPGWEFRCWTEENLPGGLRREEAYDRLRSPVERCDVLRFEVLWRFGGVYVDADFECVRSLEPLIEGTDFFTAEIERGRVNGALIGAVPGHPLIDRALVEMRPREFFGYDKEAAGPLFFDRIVARYPEATVFPKELFYPKGEAVRDGAYAVYHKAMSWKTSADFRAEAAKANASKEKAWQKTEMWRTRCKQAEAELARRPEAAPPAPRSESRRQVPRTTRGLWWLALAILLVAIAGIDGVQRFVADHDNFGDVNFLVFAAAWLALGAWAGSRGYDAFDGYRPAVRKRWFVALLLLAAPPYALIVGSAFGYLLNVALLALAVVLAFTRGRAESTDS